MSYRNAVYNSRDQSIKLFTWDDEGRRITRDVTFNPYLYLESPDGDKVSIYGTKVKKRTFNTQYDRTKYIADSGNRRLFENIPTVQQYLLETFWRENETPEFTQHPLRMVFLDIETFSPDSFPNTEDPTHTVNVITCYDTFSKKFHTFGLNPYDNKAENVIYYHCKNERALFIKFIEYIEADFPDILSGWNSEFFDIPYIINRIERLLGQEYVNRLSPVGQVYDRTMRGKFGREVKRYYISGVACIDYLDIYKRFCLKLRESYKLDAIGEVELSERKVDYGDINLATLSETDWDTFVKYNIQDVNLLVRLEEKLQYVSLLRMLSYVGLTTLEGAMGTISVINGALTIKARKRKEVISTFVRPQAEGKNPGAYVAEPKHGFKENVVSFDANSLYPNVMIALNLSPETKVGKIEKTDDNNFIVQHVSGKSFNLTKEKFSTFIKREELSITKAGFLFTQKKQGIIPEFLDHYYKERVVIKEDLFKAKKKLQTLKKTDTDYQKLQFEVERLNTKQMVIKILVNSCYGYMGNKQAPIGDDDIASSVTLTGQAVIKQAGKLLQDYLTTNFNITDQHTLNESWVYSDTDSCYFSLGCIKDKVPLKDGSEVSEKFYKTVNDLEDYLNTGITIWAKKNLLTKDSRFVFKRECIADVAVFLQKKRYVMHILDDEGLKVDKFKYVGVEVVRTTMPNAIKPYAKKIIETMLLTQSQNQTNKLLNETFDVFKSLSPEEIAFVMGVKGYEKYESQCKEFLVAKGMPIHVKSAYYHNLIMSKIDGKSETITSGDKIRYLYVEKQNKYGITTIGFKYNYNAEFRNLFKIDYVLMFEKILFNSIERFYDSVNWRIRKPTDNVQTELDDLFGF
jgi:DNA polymerase elongation subunit (family B)